jgi:serine/threonine-protein kinase
MAEELLFAGQVLCGRYRLQHLLGQGGMGRVWQASHLALGTDIAIKFLDPRLSSCDDIRSRFAQEATAAARIKSPHVVTILDSGFTERGLAFIAMELLRGEDLGRRLARDETLSTELTSIVIAQACRGLGRAHAMGIIHRDVKPENLFLGEDDAEPWVKVLDFGIAKSIGSNSATYKTDTGQILGTPLYMSPEQALGRRLDTRSDLYSLAVVAYRCLAGRPPFLCSATGELIVAVSTRVPPTASSFNATLQPSLDAWFSSMLLKDPNERCAQTARELAESFAAACDGVPPAAHCAAVSLAPTVQSEDTPTLPERAAPTDALSANPTDAAMALVNHPRRRRRTRILVGISALTLLVATLGSTAFWRRERPPPEPSRPPPITSTSPLQPPPTPPRPASIRISASPPETRLWLDGQPLDQNPFASTRHDDATLHELRAEANGHEPELRWVRFDADLDLSLVLRPRASPEPRASAHEPASKKRPRRPSQPPPLEIQPTPAPPAAPTPTPKEEPGAHGRSSKKGLQLDRSDPWKTP